jgi:plasmid stabilization system protein ParE
MAERMAVYPMIMRWSRALHWFFFRESNMPRGDKSSYTDKQKRQAEHIEEGYEHRGVSEGEAERRAWATVNKETGGGKKSGSGRRQAQQPRLIPQGWQARRFGIGEAFGQCAFGVRKEGSGNPQAQSGT